MRRCAILLLVACLCGWTQTSLTVAKVVSFVTSSIQLKHPDRDVAAYLRTVKLQRSARRKNHRRVAGGRRGTQNRRGVARPAGRFQGASRAALRQARRAAPRTAAACRRGVEEGPRERARVCPQLHQAVAQLHLHRGDPPLRGSFGPRFLAQHGYPHRPAQLLRTEGRLQADAGQQRVYGNALLRGGRGHQRGRVRQHDARDLRPANGDHVHLGALGHAARPPDVRVLLRGRQTQLQVDHRI